MTPDTDATPPVLRLDGVSAGYDGIDVLHDVALTVSPGEVVALLGANGAGKTTTLLAVSGLITPRAGSIEVLGEVGARSRTRRRASTNAVWKRARTGVAHVPEDRGLFPDLTAAENLRLGRPRRGIGRRTDHAATVADDELFDWFPALAGVLSRPAGVLSGGEQQMLAIARAVVGRPRLVLIDEMSMGLAPIIVEQLLPVLRRIATDTGAGILVVEQHIHLVLDIADRGYVLGNGRVMLDGSAESLRANRSLIEAGYLGT